VGIYDTTAAVGELSLFEIEATHTPDSVPFSARVETPRGSLLNSPAVTSYRMCLIS